MNKEELVAEIAKKAKDAGIETGIREGSGTLNHAAAGAVGFPGQGVGLPFSISVSGFKITPDLMKMIGGFSLLRASNMMGMINLRVTKEQLLDMNKKLNKIKLPKNAK